MSLFNSLLCFLSWDIFIKNMSEWKLVSCILCRWQGHQSQEPVGKEWGCGHGRTATWMIFVQRGDRKCFLNSEQRILYTCSTDNHISLDCLFTLFLSVSLCRRPLSCPLWSPSWKSSGSLWLPWWKKTSAQRSRTSDRTLLGTST